ncbi:hypothetical protein So717_20890 [Roseobacter cerasinus]|uniref:SD-repeat containing protein B domain-containing protein n=1 Tax=Roseobacter cerasinus TaxID=2602289 RepID=A0A640VVR9_9RHOB|nr:SdrD B-like domain-containing protein [Roseobacter cerasinus]GFE50336.1 hypothetical protein So717_20890 [Roseobacter cerasinus]
MTYQNYNFTAFREADLLKNGDWNINHGDKFVMPGEATVNVTVRDNDSRLSGDNWRGDSRDISNDQYGQNAFIDGVATGGHRKMFIEKAWYVKGSDGKIYTMAEVEIGGHNAAGAGDDYFTFVGDVPPAGVSLTVVGCCNVTGHGIKYEHLGATPPEPPAPPQWDLDPDTCTYTVEAESLDLHGFHVVEGDMASGGELAKISGRDGKISTDFGGEDGVYNLTICVQDECDGNSKLMVFVNGEFQQTVILDSGVDGWGGDNDGFSEVTLQGLEIAEGDDVEIRAWRDGNEFVRIDALKFEQVKFEECDAPGAVKLDFEGFAAGDILGAQIDGVTISAMGGSGDAMIFDSQNPTGGDGDLETQVAQLGNVLIVSEDGDQSDPDDVVGGKLTFEFDAPAWVFDLKVVDTEEGGTITLTLVNGTTQTFDIPNLVNGGVGQVVMDVENVVRMDVELDGSGAIDDLCFVPGEAQQPPGSLSGRYFCDDDRDGLDNDGAGNGVQGVEVELLDAAGNGTGITTTTDSEGNYSFTGLQAGTYGVKFTDTVSGKQLTARNVDDDVSDDIDSDARDIGDGMSVINDIVVVAGENTPDNDAGVIVPNVDPVATDDAGMGCADEQIIVDLSDNFSDTDSASVSITMLGGLNIDDGETILLDGTANIDGGGTFDFSGLSVTRNEDAFVFDGLDAFSSLGFGDSATASFEFKVEDSDGAIDTANVDVTFKGYASEETIGALIDGTTVNYTVLQGANLGEFVEAYTLEITASSNSALPTGSYTMAYCMDAIQTLEAFVPSTGNVLLATEANAAAVGSAGLNADNIDSVNWLLNNDQTQVDNGDGNGKTYTDFEVQEAIWTLMNGDTFVINEFPFQEVTDNNNGVRDGLEIGTVENINEIVQIALAQGDGFVAQDGDIFGLIIDPTSPDGQDQPFIFGVEYECIC